MIFYYLIAFIAGTAIGYLQGKNNRPTQKEVYKSYLDSPKWREFRLKVFKKDGFKCVNCGYEKNLHCHHLTYKRLGNEQIQDCVTLCEKCHTKVHSKRKSRSS